MVIKVSKLEAAERLRVSPSTVDRMVRRGELEAEQVKYRGQYKVFVLLDEEEYPAAEGADAMPETVELLENALLRQQVEQLEGQVEHFRQLLGDSEWRYHELLNNLTKAQTTVENMSRVLPAPSSVVGQATRFTLGRLRFWAK